MLLIGDVGGTKTALAVVDPARDLHVPLAELLVQSADFRSAEELVRYAITTLSYPIDYIALGVPGPVVDGVVTGTNLPWQVDQNQLQKSLDCRGVFLLNDLEAIASAVPYLLPDGVAALNDVPAKRGGAIAVIAPGTGLGEGYLTWDGQQYCAHPSEGGHSNFGPDSELQYDLGKWLWQRHGHVSNERVCSGRGLPNLYEFLKVNKNYPEPEWLARAVSEAEDPTPIIVSEATRGPDAAPLCRAALDLFIEIMGAEAGDMALKVLATGGVYLGGGIPPRIVPELQKGAFMNAFCAKGRIRYVMETIPVYVILDPRVALLGVASRAIQMMTIA
ncbi:MAG: glucokinase [Chloroflexi bacterium]|nr:glucokinase [Chloroflexota bacterium]